MAKNQSGVSPAGKVVWACLSKPSTKFKANGEYSVKIVLPGETGTAFQAKLKPLAEQARVDLTAAEKDAKKAALLKRYTLNVPGTPELDDNANETGNVVFAMRQSAVITPKDKSKEPFNVTIGLFDAKGKPLPKNLIIGRGSLVKVAYEVIPFKMASDGTSGKIGVSLRLKAVQVIELVKYDGQSADAYGFAAEEGFTHEAEGEQFPADENADAPATTGDGTQPTGKADF